MVLETTAIIFHLDSEYSFCHFPNPLQYRLSINIFKISEKIYLQTKYTINYFGELFGQDSYVEGIFYRILHYLPTILLAQ